MSGIKVSNIITIYEINGEDLYPMYETYLTISSHWGSKGFVVLSGDNFDITVSAKDLIKAIENATNK
jgi:hypothetical protein